MNRAGGGLVSSPALYRDEQVAALERVARLEEKVRALDPQRETDKRKRRKKLAALLAIAAGVSLVGTALVLYVLGKVDGQTVLRSNAGHMVTVRFGTTVRDVHWFDQNGVERTPLVLPDYLQKNNDPIQASSTLVVPDAWIPPDGKARFVVTYRAFGIPRKATVSFESAVTDVESARRILEGLPPWVAFSRTEPPLLYFSTLLSYKYALAGIDWGLEDGPLDKSVHFAPSTAPGIDRDDEIYTSVPVETRKVRVKLRWKDGRESAVRTFDRESNTLR